VLLSSLLTAHAEGVSPSTEVVRVKVGDWSTYSVSAVWSSTDPAAEKTDYIKFYENVAWVNNTIIDVSFSSSATIAQVIVRSNWHLKNNTEVSFNFTSKVGVNSTEVYEWAPVECIPAIIFPIELSSHEKFSFMNLEVTVNGSTSNECATQNREVDYIIFQNTMVDTSSMYNLSIYWDKYTGVVCETFFSELSFFQSYSESIEISFKIIKTNIWQSYEGLFADWNTYRHDLKRTGTYYTNKPEMKGKRILFVPTNTTLYAFDGYSGAKLWEDLEDGGWIRDIICHDSMLILAKENRVVFLDATTGRSYYGIALPNVNCLLINKDMLIVVFDYNKINAYNLSNLKSPIWSKEFSYKIFNTFDEDAGSYAVTVEDNLIYVITSDFTIFILDYLTGEDVKNQKIDVSIEGNIFGGTSIAKYNDMLYIVIENSTLAHEGLIISNVLVAINLTCFKVAWTVQVASPVPPAISNDVLYITGAVKGIPPNWNITGMAFDAFSGKVLWTPSAWASPNKSPVIYRDKILLVPNFAGLDAYDIKTGKWLWQFPAGLDTQLSLVENTAYFGAVNGTIYGLDVENNRIVFKVNLAKYIQTVIALASPSMTYTGYLSNLKATYDESTQRMFYNWTVSVESGTGRWTTKFSLYHTVSEYWKDFQSVPAKWNITTVEFMPPGYSYQWKVELYDPEGNLADVKWASASSILSSMVNARITEYSLDTGTFKVGDRISATVKIRNVGKVKWTFYVGFFVQDPTGYWLEASVKTATLDLDQVSTVDLDWIVDVSARSGTYDVMLGVWRSRENNRFVGELDHVDILNAFKVQAQYQLYGYVKYVNEKSDEVPLENALVEVEGKSNSESVVKKKTVTDKNGFYDFNDLPIYSSGEKIKYTLTVTLVDEFQKLKVYDTKIKVSGESNVIVSDDLISKTVEIQEISENKEIPTIKFLTGHQRDGAIAFNYALKALQFYSERLKVQLNYLPVEIKITNTTDLNAAYIPDSIIMITDGFLNTAWWSSYADIVVFHEFTHFVTYTTMFKSYQFSHASDVNGNGNVWNDLNKNGKFELGEEEFGELDINHNGWKNHCTHDSLNEGISEFMSLVISYELGIRTKNVDYEPFRRELDVGISSSESLKDKYGEERAIAATLWDLYDDNKIPDSKSANNEDDNVALSIEEIWQKLSGTYELVKYYAWDSSIYNIPGLGIFFGVKWAADNGEKIVRHVIYLSDLYDAFSAYEAVFNLNFIPFGFTREKRA
jgi:hypothetical protein